MSYHSYGEPEPKTKCPYCGYTCVADWVDVGVAMQQCGPYYCEHCYASEIGPYDSSRELTDKEKKTGWYESGTPVSDKANTVSGIPVDHKAAKKLYEMGILDKKGGSK